MLAQLRLSLPVHAPCPGRGGSECACHLGMARHLLVNHLAACPEHPPGKDR